MEGAEEAAANDQSPWASGIPVGIALDRPSGARIYDYLLGGYHNFEVDRALVAEMLKVVPEMKLAAQANRAFLRRTVQYFVGNGIDQILDIGSGIPTVGNVHEVAETVNPEVRVVYVDIDPVAIAHSNSILGANPRVAAIRADASQPETILRHEQVERLLDFEQPVAVLFLAVLHYVLDDEAAVRAVGAFKEAMAPGSYLAIAQSTDVTLIKERKELKPIIRRAMDTRSRSRDQIEGFFAGFELLEPGIVYPPLWRPEGPDDVLLDQPERSFTLAGAARKP